MSDREPETLLAVKLKRKHKRYLYEIFWVLVIIGGILAMAGIAYLTGGLETGL